MDTQLDIWILLFIAAAAQGFFLFFLLLTNRRKKKNSNHILSSLILLFTLTLSYYVSFWTKVDQRLPQFLNLILYFTFLFGPILLGYVTKVGSGRLPKKWAIHFIPFALVVFAYIAVNIGIAPSSESSINTARNWIAIIQNAHLLIYAIGTWVISKRSPANSWASKVALAFGGYTLCFLGYYIMAWTGVLLLEYDYVVSLGMTAFIYFLGYHGFRSPEGLYEKEFSLKYEKSSLTETTLQAIERDLDDMMLSEKLFTNGDLKLQELSDRMNISANDISQTINVRKNMKFTDYLNDIRVNYAIGLMHSSEYQECKLLAIAIDSGFNNKTSFLNAFKKKKGVSPSQYRREIHLRAS